MKKIMVSILILVISLSQISLAFALEPENVNNTGTYLRTNYSDYNYLELSIEGSVLHISGILNVPKLKTIEASSRIMNIEGERNHISISEKQMDKQSVSASTGKRFSLSLQLQAKIGEPAEIIRVAYYTQKAGIPNDYDTSDDFTSKIRVLHTSEGYQFQNYLILKNNLAIENQWINPVDYLNDQIPESVRTKSNEIVGNETDDYEKVRLLHEWVSNNIYYDYDLFYASPEEQYRCSTAETVLQNRRGICSGYSRLLIAMIQAQGIPAMYDSCISGSSAERKMTMPHAYTEAFVHGRWIRMDATWDSPYVYEHGEYLPNETMRTNLNTGEQYAISGGGLGYYYFDITPESLAQDHLLLRRGTVSLSTNGNVQDSDGLYESLGFDYITDSFYKHELSELDETFYDYLEEIGYHGDILIRDGNAYDENDNLLRADIFREWDEELSYDDFSIINQNSCQNGTAPSDWALDECSLALRNELIPNVLQKNYQSDISREDFCHGVINMLRIREGADDVDALLANHGKQSQIGLFTDTIDSDISAANQLGIVFGVGDGLFQPSRNIYRDEAAAMLMRAAKIMSIEPNNEAISFKDTSELQYWAKESIAFISGLNSQDGSPVMKGTGDDMFSPLLYFTTEQSVLTFYRLFRCS